MMSLSAMGRAHLEARVYKEAKGEIVTRFVHILDDKYTIITYNLKDVTIYKHIKHYSCFSTPSNSDIKIDTHFFLIHNSSKTTLMHDHNSS